jgi:hypothetical protein
MIGSLSQLVRGAAILAIEDGSEQISNSYSTASRSTTPHNAPILHHGHRRRGSRAMRKASTAVSSSLAITEHLGLRLAGDPQLAEFLLRQADCYRLREFGIDESDGAPDEKESRPKHEHLVTKRA